MTRKALPEDGRVRCGGAGEIGRGVPLKEKGFDLSGQGLSHNLGLLHAKRGPRRDTRDEADQAKDASVDPGGQLAEGGRGQQIR